MTEPRVDPPAPEAVALEAPDASPAPAFVPPEPRWLQCPECGDRYTVLIPGADGALRCYVCHEIDRAKTRCAIEANQLRADRDRILEEMLTAAGLRPRELRARLASVPAAIRSAMGRDGQAFLLGRTPEAGFGLSGMAGIGKTCALAALLQEHAFARFEAQVDDLGARALTPWLVWMPWPETVNHFRVISTREGGVQLVDAEIERAIAAEVLVLDDLGAERIKGAYYEDWAASQLDLVIDGRYRTLRPTWYTTALGEKAFAARYGARLYSRLCSENRLLELPRGRDLRAVIAEEDRV